MSTPHQLCPQSGAERERFAQSLREQRQFIDDAIAGLEGRKRTRCDYPFPWDVLCQLSVAGVETLALLGGELWRTFGQFVVWSWRRIRTKS